MNPGSTAEPILSLMAHVFIHLGFAVDVLVGILMQALAL